jgi:biopolymer transport protein ExbD
MRKRRPMVRSGRRDPLELDINSLLDILVILLVFLLKSFNASELSVDLVQNLTLPDSQVRRLGEHAVVVQVNKKREIWVNHQLIGEVAYGQSVNQKLFDHLKELQSGQIQTDGSDRSAKELIDHGKGKAINILLDKSLRYRTVAQVMHTAAMAGHPRFKFIVQGRD